MKRLPWPMLRGGPQNLQEYLPPITALLQQLINFWANSIPPLCGFHIRMAPMLQPATLCPSWQQFSDIKHGHCGLKKSVCQSFSYEGLDI